MTLISLNGKIAHSTGRVDITTFGQYYCRYLPKVFNYVSYRVASKTIAEDLTANIFERALVNLGSYTPERATFSTWLFTIAHHLVANYLRSQGRQPNIITVEALPQIVVDAPSPEQAVIEAEQFRLIRNHLDRLDEREQEVIALKFSSELKNHEIAEVMGLTHSHVGVLLHRGLNKLRQLLKEPG
jgi:RNA polymerase sigma-70 factor (ECF subfamily)